MRILAALFWSVAAGAFGGSQYAIIPLPQKMEPRAGVFVLQPTTQILVAGDRRASAIASANYLVAQLRKSTGYSLKVRTASKQNDKNSILLTSSVLGPALSTEGYELEVEQDSVVIRAR